MFIWLGSLSYCVSLSKTPNGRGRQKLSSSTLRQTRSFLGLKGQSWTVWETEAELFYSHTYQVIHRVKGRVVWCGRQKLSSSTLRYTRSILELKGQSWTVWETEAELFYSHTYQVIHRVKGRVVWCGRQKLSSSTLRHTRSFIGLKGQSCIFGRQKLSSSKLRHTRSLT